MLLLALVAVLALLALRSSQSAQGGIQPANQPFAPPPQPGAGGGLNAMEQAIAQYEGFNVPGSLAQRTHNPGDVGTFGGNVASYPNDTAGFGALGNWLQSKASANPGWDFYDMMTYYLTGDTMGTPAPGQNPNAYAEYVAGQLGVDPTTPVSQVLGGNA